MRTFLRRAAMAIGVVVSPLLNAYAQCPDQVPAEPNKFPLPQLFQCIVDLKKDLAQSRHEIDALSQSGGGIPAGTVAAFDRSDLNADKCPAGWTPFKDGRARMIIGAGDPPSGAADANGTQLKGYLFRVPGGELTHELTVAELPAHDHAIFIFPHSEYQRANQGYQGLENVGRPAPQGPGGQAQRYTELAGGNKPVNMMPPYIALYFCRKD